MKQKLKNSIKIKKTKEQNDNVIEAKEVGELRIDKKNEENRVLHEGILLEWESQVIQTIRKAYRIKHTLSSVFWEICKLKQK